MSDGDTMAKPTEAETPTEAGKPSEAEWREWATADDLPEDHPVMRYMAEHGPRPWEAYESYEAYVRAKVAEGRADFEAGRVLTQEEVTRRYRERRAELLKRLEAEG